MQLVNTTVSGRPAALRATAIDSSRHFTPSATRPCSTRETPTWLKAQSSRSRSPSLIPRAWASRASASAWTGSSHANEVANTIQPLSSSRPWSSTSREAWASHPPAAAALPNCFP